MKIFDFRGEANLSVNWIESLKCEDKRSELAEIRNVYSSKLTIGKKARIAILNVGKSIEFVLKESQDNRRLVVIHEPEVGNVSHSEIHNLRHDDEMIAELILQTVLESYPARPT